MSRKIFILDTSILLYDKKAIHSFPGNDCIIPLVVLDEIDRFKDKPSLIGESARYVNRFLDDLRIHGNLEEGINVSCLENIDIDQNIKVYLKQDFPENYPKGLKKERPDNQILACALDIANNNKAKNVKLITKDINLRVKSDSLGISAEDYLADHLEIKDTFTGQSVLTFKKSEIENFYKNNFIKIKNKYKLHPNQLVIGKSLSPTKSGFISIHNDNVLKKIEPNLHQLVQIEAKNKEQLFALSMLTDLKIPLVSLSGLAGSGKTFLTLAAGMSGIFNEDYERIVITRSIQPVGKDIGFLPGTMEEKMDPWLAPILDNFKCAFKDKDGEYFNMLRLKGSIEIAPLSYIRGRTFNNSYVIVDEAQNATIHELKTIITRIGKGSKIILLGDTDQIDTPYIDSNSNGLTIVIEKMKNSELTGHITLKSGQRSSIASYAAKIL